MEPDRGKGKLWAAGRKNFADGELIDAFIEPHDRGPNPIGVPVHANLRHKRTAVTPQWANER